MGWVLGPGTHVVPGMLTTARGGEMGLMRMECAVLSCWLTGVQFQIRRLSPKTDAPDGQKLLSMD